LELKELGGVKGVKDKWGKPLWGILRRSFLGVKEVRGSEGS
jgi:hypothetical protein